MIKLNDIEACVTAYREGLLAGTWTSTDSRRIFALQDDPEELGARIKEENKDPAVMSALQQMIARGGTARTAAVPSDAVQEEYDRDLDDDELEAIAELDEGDIEWDLDLEIEDDGDGSRDDEADLREDRAGGPAPRGAVRRVGGHGYNPYRDGDGKFAPGAHKEPERKTPSWRRGFDATEHQKHIDHHRRTETVHRAASLELKDKMAAIKEQAKSASPKERAKLKRQFDKLAAQREEHRAAAREAMTQRAQVNKDLAEARSRHAGERKSRVAERKQLEAERRAVERGGGMTIGRSRIGGDDGVAPAGGSTKVPEFATTPDHSFGIGTQRIRGEPEVEPGPRGTTSIWQPGDQFRERRTVVHGPERTAPLPLPRRQAESDARVRAMAEAQRARQADAERAAQLVALPATTVYSQPGVLSRARAALRRLLRGPVPA